jgi:hypothetical protein
MFAAMCRVILLQPIGGQRNGARSIVTAGDDPCGFRNDHSGRESPLFELHHGGLDVLTPRTFKGTEIETRVLRLNARQIHLRRAFWARRPYINWRIFKRVFRKGHLRLLLLEVGALPNFHSLTPDYVAVGVPQCDSASWSCAKLLTTRNVDNLVEKFQTEALPVRKAPH